METEPQADNNASYYYGVGMEINRVSNGFDWSKGGNDPGTLAFVFRYAAFRRRSSTCKLPRIPLQAR
jgi:hypothetical protein